VHADESPNLIVLDLSFFCALQAAQWSHGYEKTIDGLIRQVHRAYREFEPQAIDRGFFTHQMCMNEILVIHEANDYKLPQMLWSCLLRNLKRMHQCLSSEDVLMLWVGWSYTWRLVQLMKPRIPWHTTLDITSLIA
jgi:hypothetical protein